VTLQTLYRLSVQSIMPLNVWSLKQYDKPIKATGSKSAPASDHLHHTGQLDLAHLSFDFSEVLKFSSHFCCNWLNIHETTGDKLRTVSKQFKFFSTHKWLITPAIKNRIVTGPNVKNSNKNSKPALSALINFVFRQP